MADQMAAGRAREVFPGGNTSLGFYSFYDYIIAPDATRIMVIKGGPGVGKSSFMKTIAAEMRQRGFDVELHHCSSDNNSLDGVVIPALRVALIDGTSPHVVDPRNPGAVDEILHLGDFWDEKAMRRNKKEIMDLNQEVGRSFRRAYQYLKAAKVIYDDLEVIRQEGFRPGPANQKCADLAAAIFERRAISATAGSLRKLFASAITPDGFCNHLATLLDPYQTIYGVIGAPGTGKSTLLGKIAAEAIQNGYDCEAFYCALDPLKMEHLLIKDLNVALTTAVAPHQYDPDRLSGVINMDDCVDAAINRKYGSLIETEQASVAALLETAISFIHAAKELHDQMELYYIPNMDFEAIGRLRERTLERILSYAGEEQPLPVS